MKVFHSNVIMSVLLPHCGPLTRIALRTVSPWLAKFIKPIRVSLSTVVTEHTEQYEACIRKGTVFVLTDEDMVDRLTFDAINSDSVVGYTFIKRCIIWKDAWKFRFHLSGSDQNDFKYAVRANSIVIMNYMLPHFIGNANKCFNVFWKIVYNGDSHHVRWILDKVPYILEIFKTDCPVHDGVGNSYGYVSPNQDVELVRFRWVVTYLKTVFSFGTFAKWMTTLDLVEIIGEETGYIPDEVCKYLSRTNANAHATLFHICCHVKKPEKKKRK